MAWRIEVRTVTTMHKHSHVERLRQLVAVGPLAAKVLIVACAAVVLVGQFVSAALALGVVLSLTWSLGLRHVPLVFAITSAVLFLVTLGCAVVIWRVVIVKLKAGVVDVESIAMAAGFALSFIIAGGWLLMP